jgi:hypothetical protein
MIPNVLLYPFRVLFSGYFNDDQLASFLTGAFTVGLLWLLTMLQECVPDKFTREWAFRSDNEGFETDEEGDNDDLSFVDPWNAPLTYVSTIQKNIGELPKRFKRKHWPWETIRRKVLGEKSENDDEDEDGFSIKSNKADDSILSVSATKGEETKEDSGRDSSDSHDDENDQNENNSPTTTKLDGGGNDKCTKKDEKQLCIGSIFGLDVGGTLAKLVYFEKKAIDLDPQQIRSLREKHYVQAVSAQTVLMARMHTNVPAHGQFVVKRSTSMSPIRNFQNPIVREQNRVRSSSSDELEFKDEQEVVVQNLIPPFNKTTGHMPRRRTVAIDHIRSIQTKEHQTDPPEPKSHVHTQEKKEKKELQILPEHEPSLNNNNNKSSAEDLKNLYAIRQGSLPDDIRQFQHSVDFLSSSSRIEGKHAHEEVFGSDSQKGTKDTLNIVDDDDVENDSSSKPPKTSLSTATSTSTSTQASNNPSLPKRRSMSMLDLSAQHDQQKAEALNRFYDFARRLDAHEDSISDIQLSFHCRELGGEFHFISFETRKMNNAMDLIRFNNLHMNIRNMG